MSQQPQQAFRPFRSWLYSFFWLITIPTLGAQFPLALFFGGSLNIIALIQFMRAIQASDLSLTVPFITFTPIFLLVTSPLLVGEFPGPLGLLGLLAIVVGSYVIHVQGSQRNVLAPFQALISERGPKMMLSVALLYSLTSNIDKIGVQNSSPFFWSLSINAFMAFGLVILLLLGPKVSIQRNAIPLHALLFVGIFHAVTLLAHNFALTLASVPSVIGVKRMSVVFAVLWGSFILKETNLKERLSGALLMVCGVALMGLGEEN